MKTVNINNIIAANAELIKINAFYDSKITEQVREKGQIAIPVEAGLKLVNYTEGMQTLAACQFLGYSKVKVQEQGMINGAWYTKKGKLLYCIDLELYDVLTGKKVRGKTDKGPCYLKSLEVRDTVKYKHAAPKDIITVNKVDINTQSLGQMKLGQLVRRAGGNNVYLVGANFMLYLIGLNPSNYFARGYKQEEGTMVIPQSIENFEVSSDGN